MRRSARFHVLALRKGRYLLARRASSRQVHCACQIPVPLGCVRIVTEHICQTECIGILRVLRKVGDRRPQVSARRNILLCLHLAESGLVAQLPEYSHFQQRLHWVSWSLLGRPRTMPRRLPPLDLLHHTYSHRLLKGLPILTIGETPTFARRGGIINFIVVDDKVRFEVNVEAAKQADINISSRLLALAKIVPQTDGSKAQ